MAWIEFPYVRWYEGKKKCYRGPFFDKTAARKFRDELNHRRHLQRLGLGDLSRMIDDVYDEYVRFLERNNYSPKTIHVVGQDVLPFVRTLHRVKDLTPEAIKKWADHLATYEYKEGKRYAIDTRAHRLRQIKAFCAWMVDEKIVPKTPFELTIPEGREDAGRALRGEQVHDLFGSWPKERSSGGRDGKQNLSKLFFHIIFYGGTRLTEVLGDEEDVEHYPGALYENLDRRRLIMKLQKTKAGKPREVALPKSVMDMIPRQASGPIFRGLITQWTLRKHLAQALKAAEIPGRFRIHDGRVTEATEWARKNRDPRSSMDQHGWKSERMAMRYQKVATEERVEQAQRITYK